VNIIVTGGTSQIGKLLTYKLCQHGDQVIEIGRNKYNFWQLGSPILDVVKGEILIH
jgi:short-subunit dehydrogenase